MPYIVNITHACGFCITGFSWLLAPDDAEERSAIIPLVDEIIYSEAFVRSKLDQAYFLAAIKVDATKICAVVQQTLSQRDNPLWHM